MRSFLVILLLSSLSLTNALLERDDLDEDLAKEDEEEEDNWDEESHLEAPPPPLQKVSFCDQIGCLTTPSESPSFDLRNLVLLEDGWTLHRPSDAYSAVGDGSSHCQPLHHLSQPDFTLLQNPDSVANLAYPSFLVKSTAAGGEAWTAIEACAEELFEAIEGKAPSELALRECRRLSVERVFPSALVVPWFRDMALSYAEEVDDPSSRSLPNEASVSQPSPWAFVESKRIKKVGHLEWARRLLDLILTQEKDQIKNKSKFFFEHFLEMVEDEWHHSFFGVLKSLFFEIAPQELQEPPPASPTAVDEVFDDFLLAAFDVFEKNTQNLRNDCDPDKVDKVLQLGRRLDSQGLMLKKSKFLALINYFVERCSLADMEEDLETATLIENLESLPSTMTSWSNPEIPKDSYFDTFFLREGLTNSSLPGIDLDGIDLRRRSLCHHNLSLPVGIKEGTIKAYVLAADAYLLKEKLWPARPPMASLGEKLGGSSLDTPFLRLLEGVSLLSPSGFAVPHSEVVGVVEVLVSMEQGDECLFLSSSRGLLSVPHLWNLEWMCSFFEGGLTQVQASSGISHDGQLLVVRCPLLKSMNSTLLSFFGKQKEFSSLSLSAVPSSRSSFLKKASTQELDTEWHINNVQLCRDGFRPFEQEEEERMDAFYRNWEEEEGEGGGRGEEAE